LVLDAMRKVPRELFLPKNLREFAYEDSPLPIAGEQTISQPYIVAFMAEALMLKGGEKVLEIGAGSGYAAAVLSEIAANVYTVERLGQLADKAAATLADLGYDNVHVLHGDGTRGWPEHAPYDAIVVAAGGQQVPESLKEQLKVGGCLVIPVGADQRSQELVRVTRVSKDEYRSEDIADVRFVPLIGEQGWASEGKQDSRARVRRAFRPAPADEETLVRNLADAAESFPSIEAADLDPLLQRIGSSRILLLGEATHAPQNSTRCANASPTISSSRRAFALLQSRRTGRTPRGSITMCGIFSIHPPSGPHLHDFRPGCGGIPRCAIL
jgi:protein-L-isoaspartate(D-aspartate) O-methyltransferase